MTHIIKIDGKIVKGFEGKPIGKTGDTKGWYTEVSSELGTIEYTDDINEAYLVEGRINIQSTFERLTSRMREQGLRFNRLEFIGVDASGQMQAGY